MSRMTHRMESAISLYRDGQYDAADDLVSHLLQTNPDDGKMQELHGIIRNAQGNLDGAIASLEYASLFIPLSLAGQCVLAQCYLAIGQIELANEIFRFLISQSRLTPSLLPLIAAGFTGLGNHQLALEACRRAAECEIDNGEPFFGIAHHMERLDYPLEMVVTELQKAIEIEPHRIRYRIKLISIRQRMGHHTEVQAIAAQIGLDQILALRCANSLEQLLSIYNDAGDDEKSKTCRIRICELEADDDEESTEREHR